MLRIAINGFGRIGRLVLRALYENKNDNIAVVAINNRSEKESAMHLLKYDSIHGNLPINIKATKDGFLFNDSEIKYYQHENINDVDWTKDNIDLVYECSGKFTSYDDAHNHINNGAKKVLISAPGKDADITVVYGVNHKEITKDHKIISNGSCTTNCLAPIVEIIEDNLGLVNGNMTTIHSYTGDQPTLDKGHKDLYRARAAALSMIPTSTGAAKAISLVVPSAAGKISGSAIRVPTPNVSMVDFVFTTQNDISVEELNELFKKAARTDYKGIISYTEEKLVSIDFNHNANSSIVALPLSQKINKNFFKLCIWYDNEWGFSNRMNDVASYIYGISNG